ncbi:hypothetical protein SAMN05444355_1122 [Flavobacterium frigoris]|uniref:Uncharacterized protein n=1 Tax=Flavobacterium frigoris TaxID=229204 RepID=A0A1H9NZA3_FLAFI|nr:hypothetical protein SAMN05444355_1122 [Flavobacterium frigoris]
MGFVCTGISKIILPSIPFPISFFKVAFPPPTLLDATSAILVLGGYLSVNSSIYFIPVDSCISKNCVYFLDTIS